MRRKNILPPFPFNDAFTQNQYYKLFSDLVSSKRRLHRTVSLPKTSLKNSFLDLRIERSVL